MIERVGWGGLVGRGKRRPGGVSNGGAGGGDSTRAGLTEALYTYLGIFVGPKIDIM
ncbi:hypothetical protein GCM10010331_44050 [Streptomyces xanthochromogenes]|nr:hypothetical protein GCM10010331_44050 [Streptomyces xanthochromogenes]